MYTTTIVTDLVSWCAADAIRKYIAVVLAIIFLMKHLGILDEIYEIINTVITNKRKGAKH